MTLRYGIGMVGLLGVIGLGAVIAAKGSESAAVSSALVVLTDAGYVPDSVTIKSGATVTFRAETGKPHWPASNLHPQHAIYPTFDPARPLAPDESWSFTFDRPGVWKYHDHLRSFYVGTINVVE